MRVIDQDTGEYFELDSTDALKNDLQRWHEEQCGHLTTEIRSAAASNGAIHFRSQCQVCGELVGQAISKAQAPANCSSMDENLLARRRAARRQQYEEIMQKHVRQQKSEGSEWWTKYNAYLTSPEWGAIRSKILQRAHGRCEGRGQVAATQVHHLSYAHVFHEFLFDLVAVCDVCHDRLHKEKIPITDEWRDGFPCEGCRFQDEKDERRWCGVFDVLAVEALSAEGQCGPTHAGFEPLK